ncbi:MAG TPA: peptidase MA family metallohydrolase [Dehalococcoidia bacterium]|nr:peptidase MA family metallohydrolase [Dehalococcoidia bacterium]
MRRSLAVVLFAVAASLAASAVARVPRAAAQQPITVVSEAPENDYPQGVTFRITVASPAPLKEARLLYQLAPDGVGATAVATCTGDATVSCTFQLVSGRGIFIIPGAEITYHWEITNTAGIHLATPPKVYVHQDTRFTFKTLKEGNVTLYYHAGTQADAQAVLDAAAQTIQKIGQLEATQVIFPVKVFLYQTAAEMQPSIASGSTGRGVIVLGEVVYSDTAMVSADRSPLDITRHEVAHIVTDQATKGPYGIASWLNEGISVYAQDTPLASHADALRTAIETDTALSLTQLSSPATGAASDTVSLFYGESGSIVKYLVDTYGPEKFARLLKTFKDGSTPDNAFQTVYGFDTLGLENHWRQSVGLPPRAAVPTSTPAPASQAAAAATPPASSGSATASTTASSGVDRIAVAIIAGMIVLVAVAAAAAIVAVRRRI